MHVTAVVVTRNRKELLSQCLFSLLDAHRVPDRVVVVDNASTDGTADMVGESFTGRDPRIHVVLLATGDNLGGAGGFARGLSCAVGLGTDSVWLMDDDAVASPGALDVLLRAKAKDGDCLASTPMTPGMERYAWGLRAVVDGRTLDVWTPSDLPGLEKIEARYTPFLGMLVPAIVVARVGLPRSDFFIWSDDVEYSLRIRDTGSRIWYVPASVILHPMQPRRRLPVVRGTVLDAPLWKQYYGARNEIYLYSRRGDAGMLARRLAITAMTMMTEPDRSRALVVLSMAVADGLSGRLGRRLLPGEAG